MKKYLVAAVLFVASVLGSCGVFAQSQVLRAQVSAGVYENLVSDGSGHLQITTAAIASPDPCASPGVAKSSAAINISSATTTQLVAISGTTTIFVCGFSATISQVITTANTMKFVYGTGSACATGTVVLTGLYGAGGITAAAPLVIASNAAGTIFQTIAGQALCITTAIGASGSFQGIVSFVQQ